MNRRIGAWVVVAGCLLLGGCASVTVFKPEEGKTVAMPTPYKFKARQGATIGTSALDGTQWQRSGDSGTLVYVPVGTHVLSIDGKGSYGQTVSASSSFTVSACPLCFACPAGSSLNPFTGNCCNNGACDAQAFANFGPSSFGTSACTQALAPGSNETYVDRDCIVSNTGPVNGTATNAPEMAAVVFSPSVTGALAHIRVPIGVSSGTNAVLVSITADAGGRPGTVLETIAFGSVRPQVLPISTPVHIYSTVRPVLNAGTKYWLVIAPAAPDTSVQWNRSLDDVSIPADTTYMVNTTNSSLAGPWMMKSNLQERRPAFEIDVRP